MREDTCACRSSRRSLASWDCVMAARLSEPSGFLTMRGGESSLCIENEGDLCVEGAEMAQCMCIRGR